ncbi:hypothetical protein [Holospora undulata]|uniref:hypothetical protein n=1 Tax=Holospora undulata TaxID=1169117 RepID=UPI00054E710D|nr:hypothetical protein [Holospora undulata]
MTQVLGAEFLRKRCKKYPKLNGVCADAGYRKPIEEFVRNILNKTIDGPHFQSVRSSKEHGIAKLFAKGI